MSLYYKIQKAISFLVVRKRIKLQLPEPIASFSFDDVPNSAFINGARILKKYGFCGTYYISMGLLNENNPDKNRFDSSYLNKIFDPSHLSKIVSEGGELGCHTHSHIELYTSKKNDILVDLKKNQEKINEKIPGYVFTNFAYPYGQQTISSKIIIRNRYKSARGSLQGLNVGYADVNNLKAVKVYERFNIEDIFAKIDKAVRLNAWIILYTHDVDENFSHTGCSPEYFEKVVKYCYDKKIKVLTVEKAMQVIDK